jgi:hypothetical protein
VGFSNFVSIDGRGSKMKTNHTVEQKKEPPGKATRRFGIEGPVIVLIIGDPEDGLLSR